MTRSPESIFLLLMEAIIDGSAKLNSVTTTDNEIKISLMCKAPYLHISIIEPIND